MQNVRRQRAAARRGVPASPRRAPLRLLEAGLWVVVAALFIWRITPQLRAAVGTHAAGPDAPAVTLPMLHGGTLPLAELKGQVVLVNFWAAWCPPCRAEMPGFQTVYDARHDQGFTVLGVSMDQTSPQAVAAFLQEHHISYPVALATPASVAAFGGVNDLPSSFLLDRQGRVRYTVRGIFAPQTLRTVVDRLLAEPS
jgi:cytochrome c biogenesis protein CcmG/thiol:disulfide interchange protein DsbE